MQTVIIIVIIAAAAAYLLWRFFRRGLAGCCGGSRCGTDGGTCAGAKKTQQDKPADASGLKRS